MYVLYLFIFVMYVYIFIYVLWWIIVFILRKYVFYRESKILVINVVDFNREDYGYC